MADFTAQDVKRLRDATGAGMLDCKKALEATSGNYEDAVQFLREKGLAKAAERSDRQNNEGAIALVSTGTAAALVQLKTETDFTAKNALVLTLVKELAELVLAEGEAAIATKASALDDLKLTTKENIALGKVARIEAAPGNTIDTYLHVQDGRGVNGVIIEASGVDAETLHDVALHIAFAKPTSLSRDEIPVELVEKERASLLEITKAEGKPEQAWGKIVDGRINAWLGDRVLLEQGIFGEKETVAQKIGSGSIVRFVQAFTGA
jgi:elongation factor Ts